MLQPKAASIHKEIEPFISKEIPEQGLLGLLEKKPMLFILFRGSGLGILENFAGTTCRFSQPPAVLEASSIGELVIALVPSANV